MRIPTVAEPIQRYVSRARVMEEGITASICTPCVAGKKVCCSFGWPPCKIVSCDGGAICSPCIPFINKKYCVPGGWKSC
jgi:hypothetical protein